MNAISVGNFLYGAYYSSKKTRCGVALGGASYKEIPWWGLLHWHHTWSGDKLQVGASRKQKIKAVFCQVPPWGEVMCSVSYFNTTPRWCHTTRWHLLEDEKHWPQGVILTGTS